MLHELIPEDVFLKITRQGFCFVVDDDGTISDSNPMYVDWLARKLKRPLTIADYTRYDFSNIDKRALGMLIEGVFPKPHLHRHLPVIGGALAALQEIHSGLKLPVVILTARPPSPGMVRATYDHKVEKKVPFDLMIFSRHKKEIVQALRKTTDCRVILVDDDPNTIAAVSSLKGVTAIVFDTLYNRRLRRKSASRGFSWDEVLKIVKHVVRNGRS
ncbi:MAG: hypothetical protein WDZ67_00525 [Patescibacteria group bacterium]